MAHKKDYKPEDIMFPEQRIVQSELVHEMKSSYIDYAMSVIVGQCAAAAQHLNAGRGQLPHDALRQCTAALGLSFGFFFLIHSDLRSYGTFLS